MQSPTTTQAWPFLVTNTRTRDSVTVVAPDRLAQPDLLREVVHEAPLDAEAVQALPVSDGRGTQITIVYRMVSAPGALVDDADPVLLDRNGRRIRLIEGLVISGHGPVRVTEADFAQVRQAYHAPFRQLWEADERASEPVPAPAFPLSVANDPPLRVIQERPIHVRTSLFPDAALRRAMSNLARGPQARPPAARKGGASPFVLLLSLLLSLLILIEVFRLLARK